MGIKAVLPKGFKGTINGLEVEFDENLHFTIVNAESTDQAAEFCHIQNVPVDFAHVDKETGKEVTYSNLDASRIETVPGFVEPENAPVVTEKQAPAKKSK